jgi:hypothetical protein
MTAEPVSCPMPLPMFVDAWLARLQPDVPLTTNEREQWQELCHLLAMEEHRENTRRLGN